MAAGVTVTHEFEPADRYLYDFGLCSAKNGFAQFDTDADASYYGNWLNPFKWVLFSYCEGDCTTTECETAADFVSEVRRVAAYFQDNGGFRGIDPGLGPDLRERFIELGLGDLLH